MAFDKDRLIGKYLSGNTTPEEKRLVEEWTRKSTENFRDLEEIQKLWQVSARLKREKRDEVEKAWEEFKGIIAAEPKIRRLSFQPLKVAAVLVLCISTVFVLNFFFSQPDKKPVLAYQENKVPVRSVQPLTEPTAVEEPHAAPLKKAPVNKKHTRLLASFSWSADDTLSTFILPDGSKVYLNKHSKITYTRSGRTVELEGEAYFEVKPDSIPFFVSCKNTLVRVLGTAFNVKSGREDGTIEVMVLEGSVQVSDKMEISNRVDLTSGDVVTYDHRHVFVKSTAKKEKWWKKSSLKNKIKRFFNKLRHKTN